MRRFIPIAALLAGLAAPVAHAQTAASPPGQAKLSIVAAENFYADVARQIAGPGIAVTAILSNPDQDPHMFEVSPSVAREVAAAGIVIQSGIGYDPWMASLLRSARGSGRQVITVADLVGRKDGDNPHIWYDPATMPALAQALADLLAKQDPAHADAYKARLAHFRQTMAPITATIADMRARLAGTKVTATEPVFGEMFKALGFNVRNTRFQLAVMNDTEPSASDVAAFEQDLKSHIVALLLYNSQATDPIALRMLHIAQAAHVPVVGATETQPPGRTYQGWVLGELNAVDRALVAPRK